MANILNASGTSPGVTHSTNDTSNEAKRTLADFRKAIDKNNSVVLFKNQIHWGMKSIYYVQSVGRGLRDIDGV